MPNGRGTILVVEDEPAIRDLLRLHLGLAQFDMREARVEALLQQVWRGDPVVRSPVHDRRLRAT
jgi:DNA-binding response OmpR family regulator